jgi:hypothetical protein
MDPLGEMHRRTLPMPLVAVVILVIVASSYLFWGEYGYSVKAWLSRPNTSQACVDQYGLQACIEMMCARAAIDAVEASRCVQQLPFKER